MRNDYGVATKSGAAMLSACNGAYRGICDDTAHAGGKAHEHAKSRAAAVVLAACTNWRMARRYLAIVRRRMIAATTWGNALLHRMACWPIPSSEYAVEMACGIDSYGAIRPRSSIYGA